MEEHCWSMLPSELVFSVAERLGSISDIARLRAVCGRWAWALGWPRGGWPAPLRFRPIFVPVDNPPVPWLLLPTYADEKCGLCTFVSLRHRAAYKSCPIPGIVGRRCVGGSRDGWIVTLDPALDPRILNPITKEEFPLPSISSLIAGPDCADSHRKDYSHEDFHHVRIFLSSAPPLGIAAVIYVYGEIGRHVAFARTGDHAWIAGPEIIKSTIAIAHEEEREEINDVMCREEDHMFYVSTTWGSVLAFDLSDYVRPRAILLGCLPELYFIMGPKHIVFNSEGELLLIIRNDCFHHPWGPGVEHYDYDVRIFGVDTLSIAMFKLNSHGDWVEVFDIGDEAIFVGCNHFMWVSTVNKPCLVRNSVYFVEESSRAYCYKYPHPRGIWFTPSRLRLHIDPKQ